MAKIIIEIMTDSKNRRLSVDCRCEASAGDAEGDLALTQRVANGLAGVVSTRVHHVLKTEKGSKHVH
jgi:hypothetical protein